MQDKAVITTERPKVQRVYVVARDPDTGKSKSTTVYHSTPEEFIDSIESIERSGIPVQGKRRQGSR